MEIDNGVVNHGPGTVFLKTPGNSWAPLIVDEDTEVPIKNQAGDTIGTATLHVDGRMTGKLDDPEKALGKPYGRTVALRGFSISTEAVVVKEAW